MSEDLSNEIEAINSIYGDSTLLASASPSVYILSIPNQQVSLRLSLPDDYPTSIPTIQGTETTGEHTKKGEAQHVLRLAREVLETVYKPGDVCLFDLLDELSSHLEEEGDHQADGNDDDDNEGEGEKSTRPTTIPHPSNPNPNPTIPDPRWTLSSPLTVKKSLFLARCTSTTSPAHAAACLAHLLATDKRAAKATHNISAYRIRSPPSSSDDTRDEEKQRESERKNPEVVYQDYDDDGETAAGGRLLKQMQLMGVWDVLIVVSRWYGGVKLGPARFGVVCGVAREALVSGGWGR